MPGMRAIDSDGQAARVVQASGMAVLEGVGGAAYPMPSTPPDLEDPSTLGCLLALVREAWGDSAAHAVPDGDWHVYGDIPGTEYGTGDTEAEALVAALEAAEGREVSDE
jgi:hypothetical protein